MEELQAQIHNWCTALKDYLKCEQCHAKLTEDIYLCEAGHLICVTCIQNVTSNRLCVVCKMPYTRTRNYLAENLAGKMDIILATLETADDRNDDAKSVCSEANAAWNNYSCWISKCKFQGTIDEIRQHTKDNHALIYVTHLDNTLPHAASWTFDYAFPRVLDRLFDVVDLGLFLLHIVIYDNGALRAHIFMYESGRRAKKYKYQLKIDCCGTNLSIEADVDCSRIPRNLLASKGLFISRGTTLQTTLQNSKKFTCSIVIDRNTRNDENLGTEQEKVTKRNRARKNDKNPANRQSTSELDQTRVNSDGSQEQKSSEKGTNSEAKPFQQNKWKSKKENRDKPKKANADTPENVNTNKKSSTPGSGKQVKSVKPTNYEATVKNENEKCTEKKLAISQTQYSKISNPLQTAESANAERFSSLTPPSQAANQKPRNVNSPAMSGPVTPMFANVNSHQVSVGYQMPPAAYQSPSYYAAVPQPGPFNPHIPPPHQHFATPPTSYHPVNPHQVQSLGTPPYAQPCTHPSAPVEEAVDVHNPPVQYPDLTPMQRRMVEDRLSALSEQINERERMARSTTGTPKTESFQKKYGSQASKDKCTIS